MPGQDTDIALLVGQVAGKQESMSGEINQLHNDVSDLRNGQEQLRTDLTREITTVGSDVKTLLNKQQKQDEKCDRRHPDGTAMFSAKKVEAPGAETLGQFFSRMGKKALETVVLAAIVAGIWLALKAAGAF